MKIRAVCECGKHKLKAIYLSSSSPTRLPIAPCGTRWTLQLWELPATEVAEEFFHGS